MEELKAFRESINLDRQEFADKIHVSKSLYEKIEMGDRDASRFFIKKLKTAFPQFDTNIFFT